MLHIFHSVICAFLSFSLYSEFSFIWTDIFNNLTYLEHGCSAIRSIKLLGSVTVRKSPDLLDSVVLTYTIKGVTLRSLAPAS